MISNFTESCVEFSGEDEMDKLDLWGNYSIPKDNPYLEDKEMQPEIWAYGLRNPWRCSFDSERPSYFMCADVGQVQRYCYKQNLSNINALNSVKTATVA